MRIYNTLSKKIEELKPLNPPHVSVYTCGPTVYDYTHIGHLRKYTNDDLLWRALEFLGYKVKLVRNVTDVGHLVSDADYGEDKLEKGAKREGKTVWEVAKSYENYFDDSMREVGVKNPDVVCRATEHIQAQINLIKELEEKGFTYNTEQAVYFDVAKFKDYGKLSGQSLEDKLVGARGEVVTDLNKKSPVDFALWFKRVGHFKDHTMHWDSPWGDGFPGWHIECSAMSMEAFEHKLPLDIHTGGVDHIPVHHENEIAQSEAATGKKFVQIWMHHEFLTVDGQKMSKSLNNFYTVDDIKQKNIDPMAARYLFLSAHYRQKLNFTWEALEGAQNALNRMKQWFKSKKLFKESSGGVRTDEEELIDLWFEQRFKEALEDDLNVPKALAVLWEGLKSKQNTSYASMNNLAKVLGFDFDHIASDRQAKQGTEVPQEILELAKKRDALRKQKKFEDADKVRDEILAKGFRVEDRQGETHIL